MSKLTQADIEAKAMVITNPLLSEGWQSEWSLDLSQRTAIFHPVLKQWFWFDQAHEQWVPAGCGAGEAILMAYDGMGGIKKLPRAGSISEWCVYYDHGTFGGPITTREFFQLLTSQAVESSARVWTPRASEWLTVTAADRGEFQLYDEPGTLRFNLSSVGLESLSPH